jgi:hypothetical protein
MLRIETGLVLLSLLVAFVYPQLGSLWFESVERRFSRLSHCRALSVALVGLTALLLRAAVLPIEPIPEPIVHDEFGYLLAADTFAHGRLTNPTHPMWEHFESFSILQKPTYQCYAQPAQGMILAFGKVVFGHPFWGVWLSVGVMCAAITWMLQGWLPPQWALLGGVLAILRYGVFGYWANSYWGGAAGAIGGALVLGALPRIKSSQRISDALLMGLGLAILANSRPYEGFVFSLPIAIVLFAWLLGKDRPLFSVSLRRVLLPLTLMLALTGACMGYYFWRVTGSPFRMPYQIERETYAVVPMLLWQSKRVGQQPPVYYSDALRQLYLDAEPKLYAVTLTPVGFTYVQSKKLLLFWNFYLGPVLTVPLLMLFFILPYGFSWRDLTKSSRFLFCIFGFCTVGMAAEIFFEPHYAAPLTGIIFILVLKALSILRTWRPNGRSSGMLLARAIPLICTAMIFVRVAAATMHAPLSQDNAPAWSQESPPSFGRAEIDSELQRMPEHELVIVRYSQHHNPFEEWVYNDGDIDHSKVVWAREMESSQNDELIRAFRDRRIWLLEGDDKPPKLSCYPGFSQDCTVNDKPPAQSRSQ